MAKMSDFESAFAAARKAQGAGGKFTFNGKSYTADYAGEKGPKKKPVTPAARAARGSARPYKGGGARGSARPYKAGGKGGKK